MTVKSDLEFKPESLTKNAILEGQSAGTAFRERLATGRILPLIGIYDVFSAKLAAERFEGVFCSGFSYAASAYGLPDIGFANWHDVQEFATRVRHAVPHTHMLVDIDDGFGDQVIASRLVRNLEMLGTSAVMLEDQKRPRKCGHFEGKVLLPVEEYLIKLEHVLKARRTLVVLARTDETDYGKAVERVQAYEAAGADAVLIEGIKSLDWASGLAKRVKCPIVVNQLHSGKSPNWSLDELSDAGVRVVLYSTPCLFAAQQAVESYLDGLATTARLPSTGTATLDSCLGVLNREGCR